MTNSLGVNKVGVVNSIQSPSFTDVLDCRSCLASNITDLSPEFGKMSHSRVAEDGDYSMAGT